MARRMYDLDNGTEDIKVTSVKTNSIVATDNTPLLNYNIVDGGFVIGQEDNPYQVSIYASNLIKFITADVEVSLGGDGFVVIAPDIFLEANMANFSTTQLVLGNFSTIERPSTSREGAIIYDSTLKKCILYNGTAWVNLDGTVLS